MNTDETLRKILDASDRMVLAYFEDGAILFMNVMAKDALGYPDSNIGIQDLFLSHKENADKFIKGIDVDEVFMYRENKTCFPCSAHFLILDEWAGNKRLILAFIKDLSLEKEQNQFIKQKERELQAARNIKDEFVANMTHELRTPVNGIQGHAKNLYRDEQDPEKRKTFEIILNCCSTMNKLISDIMDYTKMQANKFELDESEVEIRKCIENVVNTSITIANAKGLSLSHFVSPAIPQTLIGDSRRIEQILNNLVSNAIKFTTMGYVRVEAYVTRSDELQSELSVLVIDTGIGIADDERDRLFKSFSQVDSSIGRRFGGTGLGLYVSRQLANHMGGDITFESKKGKGSTFSVSLVLKNSFDITEETKVTAEIEKSMDIVITDNSAVNFECEELPDYNEIESCLERLMMAIEMNSWDDAENIVESLKTYSGKLSATYKNLFLRLLMAIRNEDYEKGVEYFDKIQSELERSIEIE